jgi:hypothetical protein
MTVSDVLKATRFVVDDTGQRTAAVLDIDDRNRLLAWIRTVVDMRIAESALVEIESASGDLQRAGVATEGHVAAVVLPGLAQDFE